MTPQAQDLVAELVHLLEDRDVARCVEHCEHLNEDMDQAHHAGEWVAWSGDAQRLASRTPNPGRGAGRSLRGLLAQLVVEMGI
jgi:hypothetical protein